MRPNRREGSSLTTTAVAALLVLVTGCGASTGSEGHACTEIGAVSGVGLTVGQELADDVRGAEIQVCWDGTCERFPLDLHPGERMVDLGCESDQPDAVCSATSTPDGIDTNRAPGRPSASSSTTSPTLLPPTMTITSRTPIEASVSMG